MSAVDAARREFHEETGLTATIGTLLGARSVWLDAETAMSRRAGVAVGLLFAASEPRGTLRTDFVHDDTTVEARWFAADQLPSLRAVPLVRWAVNVPQS